MQAPVKRQRVEASTAPISDVLAGSVRQAIQRCQDVPDTAEDLQKFAEGLGVSVTLPSAGASPRAHTPFADAICATSWPSQVCIMANACLPPRSKPSSPPAVLRQAEPDSGPAGPVEARRRSAAGPLQAGLPACPQSQPPPSPPAAATQALADDLEATLVRSSLPDMPDCCRRAHTPAEARELVASAHRLSFTTFAPPGYPEQPLGLFRPPNPQDWQMHASLLHAFKREHPCSGGVARLPGHALRQVGGVAGRQWTSAQVLSQHVLLLQ